MSDKLLRELIDEVKRLHDTIGIMQAGIRNGEYDKPQGAAPKRTAKPIVTTELKTSRDW